MSQSPLEFNAYLPQDRYQQAWSTLTQMLAEGRTFSGHERNCLFLNSGDSRFSDISAISGFDFPEDGRGIALVDWDQDGDQDIWISNRTGPRIRFLRNDAEKQHHFLQLQLQGTDCNRDAIGARIELTLKNKKEKLIKTLRAGEGFVSQSSKLIHFGLGKNNLIEKLTISWPNGPKEQYSNVTPDHRYRIIQGKTNQVLEKTEQRKVILKSSTLESPSDKDQTRLFLISRPHLPELVYIDNEGKEKKLSEFSKPTLINLWASWCKPCLSELNLLVQERKKIEASKLSVIALNVDKISSDKHSNPNNAASFLEKIKFTYSSGTASFELIDSLDLIQRAVTAKHSPLPLPCSFLIDGQGRIAVIYKGPVSLEILLRDVSLLDSNKIVLRNSGVPFTGRWLSPPASIAAAQAVVRMMVNSGKLDQAAKYLSQEISLTKEPIRDHISKINEDAGWTLSSKQYELGMILIDLKKIDSAKLAFQKSLRYNSEYRPAQIALGTLLLRAGNSKAAIPLFEKAAKSNPSDVDALKSLGLAYLDQKRHLDATKRFHQALLLNQKDIDLLNKIGVVNLQQKNLSDAEQYFTESLQLDPEYLETLNLLGQVKLQQRKFQDAIKLFTKALSLDANSSEARFHLSNIYQAQGQTDKTILHLRELIRHTPEAPQAALAINNLAWILATDPQESVRHPQEALQLAEKLNKATNYLSPSALDTLAVSQASVGLFSQAIKTSVKALELSKSKGNKKLAEQLTHRIDLFRSGVPYREIRPSEE